MHNLSSSIPHLLQSALSLHQQSRLTEAQALYQEILQRQPRHAEAWHLFGVSLLQQHEYAAAIGAITQATGLDPAPATPHANLGHALHQTGRYEAALASVDLALQRDPRHVDAIGIRGNILLSLGLGNEALADYDRLLLIQPNHLNTLNNRSAALQQLSRFEEALACTEQALQIEPDYFSALTSAGNILQSLQCYEASLGYYDRALQVQPEQAETHYNRSVALTMLRRTEAALAGYQRTLQLAPGHPGALNNLGLALIGLERNEEALAIYEQVLAGAPEDLSALSNYALALWREQRFTAALAAYERALQLTPSHPGASHGTLCDSDLTPAQVAQHELVLQSVPANGLGLAQAIHLSRLLCQWDQLARYSAEVRAAVALDVPAARDIPPFLTLALDCSVAEQQRCARQWVRDHRTPAAPPFTFHGRRAPGRRLRIGYLSSDLREHATAHLMVGVFEAHRQQQLDCIAYSYGPDDDSPMYARLQSSFTRFEDIQSLSDYAAAQKIHADGIDILIDLKGYTGSTRSAILNYRAAPVQVQYLGYPGTMGSAVVDYLIADRFVIPPEHFDYYDEQIVHLPGCYQPNDGQRLIGPRPSRLEAGLPADGVVFCSFNQSYKITPAVFSQWLRILQAVPGSVLWLLALEPAASANLQRTAQDCGVDPARLIFSPTLAPAAHLARLTLADLCLDTHPYNSHTTASDALWAGVPLLTCPGQTFAARVSASLLHTLGLTELITAGPQQYEQLAAELALDPARLAALKARLNAARSHSSLFQAQPIADHLERAYHVMWQRFLDGAPPAPITDL